MQAESYQEIGVWLRRKREEYKLDLSAVAQELHIRPRYLAALEEGNIAELPGEAYARGYLANYVGYLGLDRDGVVQAFDGIGHPSRKGFHLPATLGKQGRPSGTLIIASLAVTLLAFVYWVISQRQAVPQAEAWNAADARSQRPLAVMPLRCAGEQSLPFPPCYGLPEIRVIRYFLSPPPRSVLEARQDG